MCQVNSPRCFTLLPGLFQRCLSTFKPTLRQSRLLSVAAEKAPEAGIMEPGNLESDTFFNFTRGRFVVDEAEQLRRRHLRFDLRRLSQLAPKAVGSSRCIGVKKFVDGMYNRAFMMTMDDGKEVVAKVPNPNAGFPHLTTASEVKNVLEIPAPAVYAWSSRAASNPVGAEYIIMERVPGVPLSMAWDKLALRSKVVILRTIAQYHRKFLKVSFTDYGGLYYSGDLEVLKGAYIKDGERVDGSRFSIGPITERSWTDAGRSSLICDRGPWGSIVPYLEAVTAREKSAIEALVPPKQLALLCGPNLYRPNPRKKLSALKEFAEILRDILPADPLINAPYIFHNDLHEENIFVDPKDPERITGIIDWQSTSLLPLYLQSPDPSFISCDGLEPETLERPPYPELTDLSKERRAAVMKRYTALSVFVGWRGLMHHANPSLYRAVEFRKTAAFGLIVLATRMFEYGESHFRSLLVDLKDTWAELPAVQKSGRTYPFAFSDDEIRAIKADADCAIAGGELISELKEKMGDLWPDKAVVTHEEYDEARRVLQKAKMEIMQRVARNEDERAEFLRYWPFDD